VLNLSKKYKILLITLIVFLCIFSFLFFNGYSGLHLRREAKDGQIKVACVGDSITYGHAVDIWYKNNYPVVLQNLLGDGYLVNNYGVSCATIQKTGDFPYIKTKSYKPSIEFDADILVFMLGSNDTKPYNWLNKETFKKEYIELLNTYLNDNNPEVYLCTVSRVFYKDPEQTTGQSTYFVQEDIIKIINEVILEVADEYGYNLIDIYSVTKDHREWYKDYVHPEAEAAKEIAEEIYNYIK
jgi:lysophospholipase L1-like esterase